MSKKPRIFIGSSSEHKNYAHAVHQFLNNNYAYTKLWEVSIKPGEYTLPSLHKIFKDYDYGIFIFSPDDILNLRDTEYKATRDNVLFEFGLFLGVNGLDSAFVIAPQSYFKNGRIPSDLLGITLATFDSERGNDELIDAISSCCLEIMGKIKDFSDKKNKEELAPKNPFFNILTYEGELLSAIVDILENSKEKVIFIITNQERQIIFDIIISILYSRMKGIVIDIHYYPLIRKDEISFSIELYRQLGCNVKTYPIGESPEDVVFIADPNYPDYSKLVVKHEKYSRKNVIANFYQGSIHHSSIKNFVKDLEDIENSESYQPIIVKVQEESFLKEFDKVPLYKTEKCQYTIEKIKPKNTLPLSGNLIREYKIQQIGLLKSLFDELNFELYEPTAIKLKNGELHYIVPPVLERHNNKLIIGEGHTRMFLELETNEYIKCVVVKNIKSSPVSEPSKWEDTRIAPNGRERNFVPNEEYLIKLRKVEKYLHMGIWFNDTKRFK